MRIGVLGCYPGMLLTKCQMIKLLTHELQVVRIMKGCGLVANEHAVRSQDCVSLEWPIDQGWPACRWCIHGVESGPAAGKPWN
jgi:hypothetical protein